MNDDQDPVRRERHEGGALWRVRLARPKANVLDGPMIDALQGVFAQALEARELKAICLEGEGPNFSFGASVQEHLPEQVAGMLKRFHRLFGAIADAAVPVLCAVRGKCLGGGLELAAYCHRLVAAPDAVLGQPEIRLGVFAPVASVLLTHRVGAGVAADLCLSGRMLAAEEALGAGLVDQVAEDPELAVLDYAREHLLPHSASSLRFAVRALRRGFQPAFRTALADVERLYLEELMTTADAEEGVKAFLEKREPRWRNG